jgi:hypothetical protein
VPGRHYVVWVSIKEKKIYVKIYLAHGRFILKDILVLVYYLFRKKEKRGIIMRGGKKRNASILLRRC